MSAHLARARLLLQTARPADAEREARAGLGADPRNADLLFVLCRALAEQQKFKDARAVARDLRAAAPDSPDAHLAAAQIELADDQPAAAHAAALEARRLAPESADALATLGWAAAGLERWPEALEHAEAGLAQDPEHTACGNLRALALNRLGRRVEGLHAAETSLRRNPEDTYTHSTAGWVRLERGEVPAALEHFAEALRQDPTNEHARSGLVEALKARTPVYRALLAYCFWMARLTPGQRWGVVIGGYFAYRVLDGVLGSAPQTAPLAAALTCLWLAFVVLSWCGSDLFNFVLLLDARARHVLDARQKAGAVALAGCLGGAAAWAAVAVTTGAFSWFGALALMLFALPLTRVFWPRRGWRRAASIGVTAGLGLLVAGGLASLALGGPEWPVFGALLGLFAYSWLGQVLKI